MATFNDEKEEGRLEELRGKEAEELAEELSRQYKVGYVDLSRVSINTDALRLVPEALARAAGAAAFSFSGERLNLAVLSPRHEKIQEVITVIQKEGQKQIDLFMVSPASLARAWERYPEISLAFVTKPGQIDVSSDEVSKFLGAIKKSTDVRSFVNQAEAEQTTTSTILEIILGGAIALNGSDIHLEPEEKEVKLRYRLDGVLFEIATLTHYTYHLLASRIKLASALKLNITSTRQDGRFSIKLSEKDMEVRTSVIPGAFGESIVLRLLDPASIAVPLENLGMNDHLLFIVEKELTKPNGMILTTGPTGSGKTTTLYAFLRKVNNPEIKIITIEDPVEYHLPGIVQTQTDPRKNYTFSEGLKSALRQDPDMIMVGEIRDPETAKTAVDAALTGHLVFSTLHTNNAFGAIPRLLDLDVNPKVIGPALNLALAQRLVRRLCQCAEEKIPTLEEKTKIENVLNSIQKRGISVPSFEKIKAPKGCEKCHDGFRGRIGIFEGVLVDQKIEEAIVQKPSEYDILGASEHQKILSMIEDGVLKVVSGVTSLPELERVVAFENVSP